MKNETVEEFLLKGEKEERFLISDVATHGCSGGTISDLIYYEDTVKFYNDHEDEIWDELSNMAEDLNQSRSATPAAAAAVPTSPATTSYAM